MKQEVGLEAFPNTSFCSIFDHGIETDLFGLEKNKNLASGLPSYQEPNA
jgi:hypothetical protein